MYAFFVFLNLLECDAQQFAKSFLTHVNELPAHAHSGSDMYVNVVGVAPSHLCIIPQTIAPSLILFARNFDIRRHQSTPCN